MKLLHVLWQGAVGGAEKAVYQLAHKQSQQPGWEVHIAYGQAEGVYVHLAKETGIIIVDLRLKSAHDWLSIGQLRKQLSGYDLHHFHVAEPLILLASVLTSGVRRVYTYRAGAHPRSWKQTFRYFLAGRILRWRFHGISANTTHAAHVAEKMWHLSPGTVKTTYNGLNFDLLRPTLNHQTARANMGIVDEEEWVIGTVANLKPVKRIERLIQAVAGLKGRWKLVIVGEGPLRQNLEMLAQTLGIRNQIKFVGSQTQVADWLIGMDVFVLPSHEESFGNAAVEAMALGLPTIVFSDGGGVKEHLIHGQTGWIVEDVAGLRTCLEELYQDRRKAQTIAQAGQTYVHTMYTVDRMVETYNQFYSAIGLNIC
ncbi:MAG: hypothetical protein Fur0022_34690 [Anaerolineales bacterium]